MNACVDDLKAIMVADGGWTGGSKRDKKSKILEDSVEYLKNACEERKRLAAEIKEYEVCDIRMQACGKRN